MSVKRITIVLVSLITLTGFTIMGIQSAVKTKDNLDFTTVQLQSRQSDIKELNLKYDQLNDQLDHTSSTDKKKINQLEQDKQQLQDQANKLRLQLQAKAQEKAKLQQVASVVTSLGTQTASADSTCGDNSYANYIYMHESGCKLYNPNKGSGACGLGQAWPCSKLTSVCPNMDYTCENNFFTKYAVGRYGSWEAAMAFWQLNHWW